MEKCFKYCSIQDLLIEECILQYKSDDENKLYDIMLGNINQGFTSEEYNIRHLEQGNEDVIKYAQLQEFTPLTVEEYEKLLERE